MPVIQRIAPVFLYAQQLPVIGEAGLCQLELAPDGRSDSLIERYDHRFCHGNDVTHRLYVANDRCAPQSAGKVMRSPNGCSESQRNQFARDQWDFKIFKSFPMFFDVVVPPDKAFSLFKTDFAPRNKFVG